VENKSLIEQEIELLIQAGLEGQELAHRIDLLFQSSIEDGSLDNSIEPLIQSAVDMKVMMTQSQVLPCQQKDAL
jgi:hypothetical protein